MRYAKRQCTPLILTLDPYENYTYAHNTIPLAIRSPHSLVFIEIVECLQLPFLTLSHLPVLDVGTKAHVNVVEVGEGAHLGVRRLCTVAMSPVLFARVCDDGRIGVASAYGLIVFGLTTVLGIVAARFFAVNAEGGVGAAIVNMTCTWLIGNFRKRQFSGSYQ